MTVAFDESALRHWADAELLNAHDRVANADHHYGFAAECALKVALMTSPGRATDEEEVARRYKKHIDELWSLVRLQDWASKRYPTLASILRMSNPFEDWSVEQRYHSEAAVSRERMTRHSQAARRVMGALTLLGRSEQ